MLNQWTTSLQERELLATHQFYWLTDTDREPETCNLPMRPLVEFDRIWCTSEFQAHLVARWYQDNGFRARRAGSKVVVMVKVQ